MSVLSDRQIAGAASAAGFTGRALTLAVAVALAESGGNPTATHRNTNGSTDYGLWQINSIHADILRAGSWSNPADNARMAHSVYADAGGSFRPWTTYLSGRYLAYVGRASAASGSPLPPDVQGSVPVVPSGLPIPNPLAGLDNLAALVTSPATWLRVAMFVGGGSLLVYGVLSMTKLDNQLGKIGADLGMIVATGGSGAAAKAARAATTVKAVAK